MATPLGQTSLLPQQTPDANSPGFFDGNVPATEGPPVPLDPVPESQPLPVNPLAPPPQNEMEPVQTAGMVTNILKAGAKKLGTGFDKKHGVNVKGPLERATTEGTAEVGGNVIIRQATEADIEEFNTIVGKTSGVPSPTQAQKDRGIPVVEMNLENIDGPDDLKAAIDKVSEVWKNQGRDAGRGTIGHDQIKAMATELGMEEIVTKLLTRKAGTIDMSPEEIYKGLQAITSSALQLNRLAEVAADINAGPLDLIKFKHHMSFHSALQSNMKGLQTEVARALGIFNIPRTPDTIELGMLVEGLGGQGNIQEMAQAYLKLPTQAAKNKFADKGFAAKFKDMWFEMFVNGLLSGLQTHGVNFLSNAVYAVIQAPIRMVAGGFGATRRFLGTDEETVFAAEGVGMIADWYSAVLDSGRIGYESMKTGKAQFDTLAKVESANHAAITAKNMNLDRYGALGAFIDYFGLNIRIPGRLLQASDDFFKAFNYRVELGSQIRRERYQGRLDGPQEILGADGKVRMETPEELETRLANQEQASWRDPSDEIHGNAENLARINTFTNALGKHPDAIRRAIRAVPLGRYAMPFFRVVYNITARAAEMTPLGAIKPLGEDFGLLKKLNTGSAVARDTAYAKAVVGTSIMGATAMWASEGRVTGTGPADYKLRRQMEELGWRQYSLVWKKPGVENPRTIQVGQISFLHPDDVTYTSYARFEPISMILSVTADIQTRLAYPNTSEEEAEVVAVQAADVLYEYMKDQTFLQGFSQIAKAFSSHSTIKSGEFNFLQNLVATQVPYSTLVANIEKVMDPRLRNIGIDPKGTRGLRDLYAGLLKMDERIPLDFTKANTYPTLKNVFHEPIYQKRARVIDQVLPPGLSGLFGVEHPKADPVKMEIVRLALPMEMTPNVMKGVRLDPFEQDHWNRLTNFLPPARGEKATSLYKKYQEFFDSKDYAEMPYSEKQKEVRNILELSRQSAKEIMLDPANTEFADLQARVAIRDRILSEQGRQVR